MSACKEVYGLWGESEKVDYNDEIHYLSSSPHSNRKSDCEGLIVQLRAHGTGALFKIFYVQRRGIDCGAKGKS